MKFVSFGGTAARIAAFVFAAVTFVTPGVASAAPQLTINMLTWNIVGLDSNNPLNQGPYEFLSGARVCNTGTSAANDISVNYTFDTANQYINISPRGTSVETDPLLLAGDCNDYYFLIRVTRTPLAYNTTRKFHITASASNTASVSTPLNRELYVEHLISQNRNDVISVDGPSSVYVGQTVNYVVHSNTATQGYEQLSSFLDFPNLLFRVMSVSATYSTGGTNDRVYSDACTWDPVIGPTPPTGTYRSCLSTGKQGNEVVTTYSVRFMSAGSSSLIETIYDFSGSSYHYNADIGLNSVNITTQDQLATVKLNKHCQPAPATPGSAITCTIEYANTSTTTTYTGVEIRETYDPRMIYVSAAPAPTTSNNVWSIGNLAPGAHGVITVSLTVANTGVVDGDNLVNHVEMTDTVARANDSQGDPAGMFAVAEDTLPIAVQVANTALLRVTKTGAPDPDVASGGTIVYTINYQNLGPATSYNTVLTDTLPSGLTFFSSSPAPTTSAAPVYTWNVGNLASGASGSITMTVTTGSSLPTGTILTNYAALQGQTGAGTISSAGLFADVEESQFAIGGAQAQADISVTKTDSDPVGGVPQGGILTYTMSVQNAGPNVATNVVFTDTLGANKTFTSSSLGTACTNVSGTVTCSLGTMAVGASTTFTINVVVSPSAPTAGTRDTNTLPCNGTEDICNNVSVTADQSDPNTANNTADEPTNVVAVASVCDLSMTKTHAGGTYAPGATITYNLSLANAGPQATGSSTTSFVDKLPTGVTYVSSSFTGGGSCGVPDASNTIICSFNGNVPSGGNRTGTITVSVNANAPSANSQTTGACTGSEDLCNQIVSMGSTGCRDTNQANNTTSVAADVARPSANLGLTKTDSPDSIAQGDTLTYTLNVTNAGPAAATNVDVVDTLPSNVTYVSSTASGGCTLVGSALTCRVADLANGGSTSFTITTRVNSTASTILTPGTGAVTGACTPASADLCNSATVSSYATDPTPANNTATQPTNVTATVADLSLTKTDSGDPLLEGGVLVYTMTVSNLGTGTARNVTVVDTLGAGEYYLESTASGGCVESPAGTLTCSLADIANLGSTSFTVTVFVPTGAPTAGTTQNDPCTGSPTTDICNTAVVSSSTPDPSSANNTAVEPTNILPASADVQITKNDTGSDPAALSGTVTYNVHVANPGPQDAQDVTITDVLDSDTTYVSDTFGCVQGPAHTLTCDIGALLVGQSYDFTVTVTVNSNAPTTSTQMTGACAGSEDICNNISVSSSTSDPTPANNSAQVPTNVLPNVADLSVVKSDAGFDPVLRGGTLTYGVTVTNNGPNTATSVVVTDNLSASTTYVSNTGGCSHSAGVLTCNLGSLASGASTSFTVTTTVSASAPMNGTLSSGNCNGSEDICNSVSVTAAESDPTPANNSDSEPTDVTPNADVAVDKTGPASVVPGNNVVYTVTVTNNGPGNATSVSVADPTPSGLTFVSNSGDCTTAYPCSLGTLASGATRTITSTYSVPATYTTPTPVVNTATVSTTSNDTNLANNSDGHSAPVAPQADLRMSKDDGTATYAPGGNLTYTITASNFGPSNVTGATVTDTFPAALDSISWTCSGTGGGTCPASGTGDISTSSVNLPVGATVTFLVSVDIIAGTSVNPLINSATVSVPSGTTDPTPGNNTDDDQDAPAAAASSIGDRVWLDEDGDGVQDAGEDGIAGATVQLYDSTGTILLASTTTDTDGRYIFTGRAAGTYVVRILSTSLPAGLYANPTYDYDSGTTTPNASTTITVAAGVNEDRIDFGFNWVAPATTSNPALNATGTIGDRIWNDADSDGVQDFGEAGIAGVQVRLLVDTNGDGTFGGAGDAAAVTTTTDASGHYIFDGIAPGAYVINVNTATLPAGFTTTPTGDPDGDFNNTTNPILVAPGDVFVNADFGYPLPTGHTIGDTIYVDADADGVRDGGEVGMPGVTVSLLDNGGQIVASTITDANGNFLFPGLANGTYSVVVTDVFNVLANTPTNTGDPDGGFDRISTVVLAGADNLVQDFGFAPGGHEPGDGLIGDTIYLDRDNDAVFDAGEGLEGVTVNLYAANGTTLVATVYTDINGRYLFGGLDATKTYVVRVDTTTLPGGGAGMTNTVDPDGGIASQSIVDLTLFAGATTFTQDFGYRPNTPNTISGTVFNDANGNGTKGAGETTGYAGVTVILRDANGNIVATTTTDASGNYSFAGIPNGTYTVDVSETANVLGGKTKSEGPNPGADNNSQVRGYSVTVTGGQTNTTADFGYYTPVSVVGDFVFNDTDNDGIQDAGEVGIANAVVTLTITYPNGNVVTESTVTSGTGAYSFTNLRLDESYDVTGATQPTYSITVATPANFTPSPIAQGGNVALDSNNPAGAGFTPTQGATDATVDFGFTPVTNLVVDKAGPGAVTPGNNVAYTITVSNGASPALGVVLADPTPAGLTFVSASAPCAGGFPCAIGTIAANSSVVVTATFNVPGGYTTPDPIVNTASATTTTSETSLADNSDSASTALSFTAADILITKTGPASAVPGQNVVFTLHVQNNGPDNATNVVVSDVTPGGISFVSVSGGGCSALPCTIPSLLNGGFVNLTLTYAVPAGYTAPNPISNTANAFSNDQGDPNPANNSDTETVPLAPSADLELTKTGPASAVPGTNVAFTITVTNHGPSDAQNVSVADPTPAGLGFVSNSGACATAYPCSLGTLASGASATITTMYSVPAGYTAPNPISNTATASSTTPDPGVFPNSDTENVPLVPSADLELFKSGPASAVPGNNATFTITVINHGPSDAQNVSLADPTPSGLGFVSATAPCAGGFPCSLGTIASAGSAVVTVTYSVPSGYTSPDPISNTATASSTTPDPGVFPNSDTANVPLAPSADLELTKTAPASVTPGSNAVFTVTLTNHGPSAAQNVSIADPTPSGLTFVSATAPCAAGFPCSIGTLAASATATINVTYSVPSGYTAPNPVSNTATASSTTPDPGVFPNADTATSPVTPTADLSITKDDGSAVYVPGGSLTYTITVSNAGPSNATGASVSDVFPPQISAIAWTCSGTGGGSCSASGNGDIADTVNLPVGASVTYLASVDIVPGATVDPLVNIATVTAPPGVTDPVPANNSDDDQDARAAAPSFIGDRLWLDEDGDGVQDAGEDGLAGVIVRLYDATGTVLITATTTDTDGRYIFADLAAGTYVVRVDTTTLPAGLAANPTYDLDDGTTAPDGETSITVAAGVFNDSGDFGFNWVAPGTSTNPAPGATGMIGDRIWNDADMDGVEDFGEAGIADVTVRLLSDDNGDGVYGGAGDNAALTTTTDAAGHYYFDGLAAGAYVIDVVTSTLPAGYSSTPTGDPDSDGDTTSNPIVLAPGDVYVTGDFGFPLPGGHTIGNTIYLDADADGVRDPGEPGIANVTIVLVDASGNVVASTVTDANGEYTFPGLADGIYSVVVTDSANILAGASANTGDPDGGNDRLSTVVLAGADNLTQDFGFAPAGHDPGDGLIGDTIFLDRDNDGIADAGEGIEGVTVNLYASDGTTLIASAVTNANGQYVFGGLDSTATYVVAVDHATLPNGGAGMTNSVDPDGGFDEEATVDLTAFANGVTFDQDFAYEAATPNTIGGTIFNDANGNGTRGGGETGGYAGITVILRDQDGNVVGTTTTDASGNYSFGGLPDGTYTVEVSEAGNVLGGLVKSTGPNPGADNNSQVAGYSVTVSGGATNTTGDFGYFAPGAAFGNFVFNDTDGDGIQDPSETGIAGVAVTLTITYPNGDVTTVVTVTDAQGAYSFGNLLLDESFDGVGAGEPTYEVTVATPADFVASPVGAGGNPQLDSNDPSGAPVTPMQGVTDTTDDALATSGIDFGFVPVTNLVLDKTGPGAVTPGSNIVYTITVTNGAQPAANVVITDPTPTGLTFVSASAPCASGFPCSVGTIAASGSVAITATYSVPGGYTTPDPIVNTASVSTSTLETSLADNSDGQSTNISFVQADLSIVKSGPASAMPGQNVVFTLHIANAGPAVATNDVVTDPTPGGLTLVSVTGGGCSTLPCTIASLAVGGSVDLTVTYSVPSSYTSPDPISNTASVFSNDVADPDPSDNTDTATVPISPTADVEIVKSGPAQAVAGANVVFTVVVTNHGPSNAQNVVVADPTPSGLLFASNSGACATAYPCSLGTLASGATRTITSTYTVPAGYTSPDPIVNTATVSSTTPDPVPGNNSDDASVPLAATADLAVTKSDAGATVARGSSVTYTINVTNNGPRTATNVTAVDTLDPNTTYVSDSAGCTQSPVGRLTCNVGSIASGASASFTVTVLVGPTAPSSGTRENGTCTGAEDLCNRVTVSSDQVDPVPSNNSDSEPTDVATVDLRLVKSDAGTGVNLNEDFAYTLMVANDGSGTATNVTVVDVLDSDTSYVSDDLGCTETQPNTLTCPIGSLAPGASLTFHVIVHTSGTAQTSRSRENGVCNGSEDLCNNATVAATETDAFPSNNSDSEPTNVRTIATDPADLSITKTDVSSPVQAGAFATYTISVTNNGPDAATGVQVVDTLDAYMTYVGGTLACTEAPTGMLTCPIGDMAAGETVAFDIVVRVDPSAPTASSASGVPCSGAEDMCNRASVSADQTDPDPSNNVADVSTDVVTTTTSSALSLVKSDLAVEPVQPGDAVTYQIVVSNAGPDAATGVVVYDLLDPEMTYVSDDAGCTVRSSSIGTSLTCPVGTIANAGSATVNVVVTIAADAPVDSTRQDGDCDDLEDVCNDAFVASASADAVVSDNFDSEPTDVSASATCENGIVDAGEDCDPPDAEICNNGIDDDGNLAVDCADPACQVSGFQSCDGNCQLAPACVAILNDPARISNTRIKIHGRFIPSTDANPTDDGIKFTLSNSTGLIYSVELDPGVMVEGVRGELKRWVYKDTTVKNQPSPYGIYRLGIHQRIEKDGATSYPFTIITYGDLTVATEATMTSQIYIGDDTAYLTADWLGKPGAWYLTMQQAYGQ